MTGDNNDTIAFRITDLELVSGMSMGLMCRVVYTSLDGTITFETYTQSALFVPLLTAYQQHAEIPFPRAEIEAAQKAKNALFGRKKKDT